MKVFVALFTIMFSSLIAFAQTDTLQSNDYIESLLEDASIDKEDAQLYDLLEELSTNPIDINNASQKQLLQIPFLNENTAKAIIQYRNLHDGFSSIEELKNIDMLNDDLIDRILPFIKINEESDKQFKSLKSLINDLKIYNRFRTLQDIQIRKGFLENKFIGSRQKIYNRFLINSKNYIRAGLLFEKDSGEKSLIDFKSYHFQVNNFFIFSNIIFGDYTFEFGQGLSLWGPYSFSKGIDAVNIVSRNARGIVPYISTDENRFMHGAAMNINFGSLTFSPFFSNNKLDASIDSNTNKINSIIFDGYHRTISEIDSKDILNEQIVGLATHFSFDESNRIGMLYYRSKFNKDFSNINYTSSVYEYYSFSFSSTIKKLNLSGEFAYNNNTVASINIAQIEADKNFSIIFSLRYFPMNFVNLHGNSFGEKGTVQNELGFYTGIYFKTLIGSFNLYYDQFRFLKASNSINFPSNGNEFLIYYNNKIFRNGELRLKYKYENKEVESTNNEIYTLAKRKIENLRFDFSYNASHKLKLKTRIETIYFTQAHKEKGYLLFQEINYRPYKFLQLNGRIIFFQTDSYNSRLYEYENDLAGVITIPALYGEGIRWYILIKYNTSFGLSLFLKYSELYKPNEKNLGSGYNEITGNLDNRLSLQIDWKL